MIPNVMPKLLKASFLITTLITLMSLVTAQSPLTLAFIPQENPEKLLGDIAKITHYLESELDLDVRGFVSQDHAAAVEAMRNGEADISFMGGLPYVLAHDQIGVKVILGEIYRGSPVYRGRIFVRKDSGIVNLEQLRNKTIAFADPISESGYLYPLDVFAQAGLIDPEENPMSFFDAVFFAGGYQQAIQAMANGFVDAAGVSQFAELLLTPEQLEKVDWIAESDLIPSHSVVARQDLDPDLLARFTEAMLQLNEPDYQHLLQYVYGHDGYVKVTDSTYDSVRELARKYGYLE
ncbi:MAG: phosphate/phosphite/phosphonate ABC transporter substrate-binding protein [Deinococcales bacterium]|nr:phosphate/phosphite/phosphonate ABC transporter substrate-binding protein [Deinococcales bacterium]